MGDAAATARRLGAVLAAGLTAALACGGCTVGLPQAVAALGYVNRAERFAMDVPAGWEVREQGVRPQVFVTGPAGAGGIRPNVNVVVEPSGGKSQAEWAAANRSRLEALAGFRLVGEASRDLADGRTAEVLTFRHSVLGREVVQRQMYALVDGRVYVVTATGDPDTFAGDEPSLEICLRSFRAGW